jgi:hypothetical protein
MPARRILDVEDHARLPWRFHGALHGTPPLG